MKRYGISTLQNVLGEKRLYSSADMSINGENGTLYPLPHLCPSVTLAL